MRITLFPALLALGLLVGCESQPPPAAPAAPQIASNVSGTIMLREPRALGNNARAELKVIDVSQPDTPLAQITIEHANHPPISFNLPIDPKAVDPLRTYAVDARLIDGERRFLPVLQYPVLTKKSPSEVQIILTPEPTPAEKMYEAYKKAFGEIGSLKSVSGGGQTPNTSTAWDAFYTNGKIKVVREITDMYDDKANEIGRVTTKMTYKDDKPWVIVKEESAGEGTRPSTVIKVGWDDTGTLVLKDKLASGQAGQASPDEANALHQHAVQALAQAQAKVPKPK
ncbi:MAG: YbaY family lipoprotein [Proteobacteria bacterium]|nr:YbaY family lipoprotein [Pseudomonadota bacterium]